MSSKDYLIDATTRNAVFLQRFAGGEFKKAVAYLDALRKTVNAEVMDSDLREANRRAMQLQVQAAIAEYNELLTEQVKQSGVDAAKYSAGFTKRLMDKAATVKFAMPAENSVQAKALQAVMTSKTGVKSIMIHEAISQYGVELGASINRVINTGIIEGQNNSEIIKALEDQFLIKRRQAETLVRTVVNSGANIGRMETLIENEEFLDGYEWVAKLDSRTTLVCASRDGKVYTFGGGNPMPPAHWNCRSQIVAALKPELAAPGLEGEKVAEGGKVTANTTYGPWLKRQPYSFVVEALGDSRAQLFMRGELPIERFVDVTGRTYTLDELRLREPMAFERAGIEQKQVIQ